MNLSRWIVVPIASAVVFAVGYGISALFAFVWPAMPDAVRWGIPIALLLWYLYDAWKREQPQP
jgi:hypothetical protein